MNMKSSTAWFLGILGLLLFLGLGITLVFVLFVNSLNVDNETVSGSGDRIAVVELKGEIVASEEVVKQFKKYREDRSVRGVLFRVDSPGGGVVASQEIYEEVKKTREHGKPVVVSMGALAASGGFYVSCGANMIVANPGTLTGSIGVISQFLRVDPFLAKIGIEPRTIKTGKYKDSGSPFRKMTKEDQAYFQSLMNDVEAQFVAVVEKERGLKHRQVVRIADGRVFTGEQAVQMHLVDTIGTYEDAIAITAKLAGIRGEPSLVRERTRGLSLFERVFGQAKIPDFLGLGSDLMNRPIMQYRMPYGN